MNIYPERMRILSSHDTSLAVFMTQDFARKIGIRSVKISALAIAVSELTTNIIKYAGTGIISVDRIEYRSQAGVEVVVEDRGPGIADIEQAMQDHVSSSGTLGLGLPGTKRLVDDFELESTVGQGTRVRVVMWA